MLLGDLEGDTITLVSFFKKNKLSNSHRSPKCTTGTCVIVAVGGRRSEPNFSYSLRSFLLNPMGSMKTLMGLEPDHVALAAFLLLCSSQKILLPSYLGALVNLSCSLPS